MHFFAHSVLLTLEKFQNQILTRYIKLSFLSFINNAISSHTVKLMAKKLVKVLLSDKPTLVAGLAGY